MTKTTQEELCRAEFIRCYDGSDNMAEYYANENFENYRTFRQGFFAALSRTPPAEQPAERMSEEEICDLAVEHEEDAEERGLDYVTFSHQGLIAFARAIESRSVERGQEIDVTEQLPPEETPVLILYKGQWRIGERCWDKPTFEDTYEAYWYWDDPYNDGQDWERHDVTKWQALPPPPKTETKQDA